MKKIAVIANPYIAVDKDGVPQGVVSIPGIIGRFIGANIDLKASEKAGRTRVYFPAPNEKKGEKGAAGLLALEFTLDATVLNAVRSGSLIATTKEGAGLCGISDKEYLEPEAALAAERKKALEYYRAIAGKSAELQPIPQVATPAETTADDAAPATATDRTKVRLTETLTLNTEA